MLYLVYAVLRCKLVFGVCSVSNGSGLPGCGPVRVITRKAGVPTGFRDGFELDRGSILRILHLWLQLSI